MTTPEKTAKIVFKGNPKAFLNWRRRHRRMTKKTITVTWCDDYRVPDPSGREGPAYYTDDKDDAIDTARLMWAGATTQLAIRFRNVDQHPEGTTP